MDDTFWLQPNQNLTIEVIQNILQQKVTLKYSPDLQINSTQVEFTQSNNAVAFSEITNLAIGLGAEVPTEITRVMLLLLADFFAKHPVSNNPAIIVRVLEFYQFDVFPQVFTQGLYASPTAHLLLSVFGKGKVYYQGYLLKAADVHDIFSWQLIDWPENLPTSLLQTSFLSLSSLIYSFIQFKELFRYAHVFLSEKNLKNNGGGHFQNQAEQLKNQLEEVFQFSNDHPTHVSGLTFQLIKLLTKFGEHISEYFSDQKYEPANSILINENLQIEPKYLQNLLEQLSQENLFLFENSSNSQLSSSTNFTNLLAMQLYQTLLNLEQILAIATLPELSSSTINSDNKKNKEHIWATAYRNQVVNVLQEANFAELIRKTVTFMYATSQTDPDIA